MLANWIKQTTATTGTGTITLGSADTGFVGIADQFSDGDTVQYIIENGNNKEEGRGVFDSGAGTLTRPVGEVVATLTAGTLAKYPGATLNLSGSSTVIVSSSADTTLGAGITYTRTTTNNDLPDNVASYASTVTNAISDTLYLMPAIISYRRRITKIWLQLTTGEVGKDAYGGIWAQASDGSPGLLLADSGVFDGNDTSFQSNTITEVVLEPGVYWFGFKVNSTTVIGRGVSAISELYTGGPGGVSQFSTYRRQLLRAANVVGALASNPTITGSADDSIMVGFDE